MFSWVAHSNFRVQQLTDGYEESNSGARSFLGFAVGTLKDEPDVLYARLYVTLASPLMVPHLIISILTFCGANYDDL